MSRVEHIIPTTNGAQHKIIAESFIDPVHGRQTSFYVLSRPHPASPWTYLSERPHPDWRSMSVDEYLKNGRSEALNAVGSAEVMKALSMLEKLDANALDQEERLPQRMRMTG